MLVGQHSAACEQAAQGEQPLLLPMDRMLEHKQQDTEGKVDVYGRSVDWLLQQSRDVSAFMVF